MLVAMQGVVKRVDCSLGKFDGRFDKAQHVAKKKLLPAEAGLA